MPVSDAYRTHLTGLAEVGRLRSLRLPSGVDFASNDYLGLAGSRQLRDAAAAALGRRVPTGSGGSRLLRGNHPEHAMLEEEAGAFFGSESALFLGAGYAANTLLFGTLPQRGDLVLHDELIHASAHEGMRLGRAEYRAFAHNDADAVADAIRAWRHAGGTGMPWIAVESLYSMDGDRAPLAELIQVARRHDAVLVVDEAHATGVFGPDGRGLAHALDGQENVIVLRTCGKALGCEGALLCLPAILRDFLVNRGRGLIFSTAPSPLMASLVRASLRLLRDEPERRKRLAALVAVAGRELGRLGIAETGSQIVPVVLGDEVRTMRAAERLQAAGLDVRGIRPPTVPAGTSRLRVSLTLNATPDDVVRLAAVLEDVLA